MLLAGVNDCLNIQRQLIHDLVRIRVRPYYLYQCDLVSGAGHFRTPVGKGVEIIEGLRGHTSGYAIPTFVVDAPGGGGKIPLMPNYLISQSDHSVVLRNYEGYLTAYEEPSDYRPHDPTNCAACQSKGEASRLHGVAGLLSGDAEAIKPEGFDELHARSSQPDAGDVQPQTEPETAPAQLLAIRTSAPRSLRATASRSTNGRSKPKRSVRARSSSRPSSVEGDSG